MSVAHKWSPIEDIPDAAALSDGELTALIEVWKDQGGTLAAPGAVSKFSEQLNREWAIETGIIERAYTLDRGTTQELIEKGIEASLITREATDRDPEELAAILQDHLDALEGMFAFIKGERELTVGYIKELHSALLRHVKTYTVRDSSGNLSERELVKGAYKTQPNSPTRPDGTVHEYCPPEHVASEMDRLIEIHAKHVREKLAAEIQAAWLHHAFTQIHPFADGNGRVARTLASLVLVKAGGFPLVIRRDEPEGGVDHRRRYIDALEEADEGKIQPLVDLFVRIERRILIRALQALPLPGTKTREQEPQTPEEAINDIRDLLVSRGEALPRGWGVTESFEAAVLSRVKQRLHDLASKLQGELAALNPKYHFSLRDFRNDDSAKWAPDIALHLGYELIPQNKSQNTIMDLHPGPSHLLFALYPIGKTYRGIMAGVLVLVRPDRSFISATSDIFQLNYKDTQASVIGRFNKWLEDGLTRALFIWRGQI
jgi:Fic family protein